MKKTIVFGIIIIIFSTVSYVTAVPTIESKPLMDNINQIEELRENINEKISLISNIDTIYDLLGLIFLIPAIIFLIFGLLIIFDIGGTFVVAGLFSTIAGVFLGVISLICFSSDSILELISYIIGFILSISALIFIRMGFYDISAGDLPRGFYFSIIGILAVIVAVSKI